MAFWSEGTCQGDLKVLWKRDDNRDPHDLAETPKVILPTKKHRDHVGNDSLHESDLKLKLNQETTQQLTFKFSRVQTVQFCSGMKRESRTLVQLARNPETITMGPNVFEVSYEQKQMDSNQVTFQVGIKRKDFTWRRYFFSNLFGLTPRTIVALFRVGDHDNMQFAEGFPLMFENTLNFEVPPFTVLGAVKDMRLLITDATGILGQQELMKMAQELEKKTKGEDEQENRREEEKRRENNGEEERATFGDRCCGRPCFWVRNLNDAKINSKLKSLCEINIVKVKEQDGKRTVPALLRQLGDSKGLTIQTIIGIDFSSSNRSLLAPEGLHRDEAPATEGDTGSLSGDALSKMPLNMYEGALKVIYDVMSQYDGDNTRLEMWGLCAEKQEDPDKEENQDKKANFFRMGARHSVLSSWVDIRNLYAKEKKSVQFSGPTKIAPFLKEIVKARKSARSDDMREHNITDFQVVFILTDGMISDVTEIAQVVKETAKDEDCSMMFVFVQISKGGGASAQALKKLDKNKLTDLLVEEEGEELPDIVDCVEFKEEYLRYSKGFRTVFSEIPRTIVTLYGRREAQAKRKVEDVET